MPAKYSGWRNSVTGWRTKVGIQLREIELRGALACHADFHLEGVRGRL